MAEEIRQLNQLTQLNHLKKIMTAPNLSKRAFERSVEAFKVKKIMLKVRNYSFKN